MRPLVVWVCYLVLLSGCHADTFAPSFGDVAVREDGLVVVNLTPEAQGSTGLKPLWRYICSLEDHDREYISDVLSVQLGYKKGGCNFVPRDPDRDPEDDFLRITCDSCTGSEAHILRCCNVTPSACNQVLAHTGECQDSKREIYQQDKSAYPGEVVLFPPVSSLNDFFPLSFSMGLVAVKKRTPGSPTWKFVSKDTPTVPMTLVSTFCRQMGFTHVDPGSVTTLSVARDLLNYNFSYWNDTMVGPRFKTSEMKCPESQCCLHCCNFINFDDDQQQDLTTSEGDNDLLVIRCTYYLDASDSSTGGDKDKCQINSDGELKTSYCSTKSWKQLLSQWLPIGVLVLMVSALLISNILLCLKCMRRNGNGREGYENIEQPRGCWERCRGRRNDPQPADGDPNGHND